MSTHVVVTVYTNAKGTVFTHAYGPFTASQAKTQRKKLIDDHWWLSEGETLRVTACKMLGPFNVVHAAPTASSGG